MRGRNLLPYAAFVAVQLAACSLLVDADRDELGAQPQTCALGDVYYGCRCRDGAAGYQTCDADGIFTPCRCDRGGEAGSGAGQRR